jgi:hypothetical protein
MKKILLTGMNANQCTRKFFLRQQLKVIPSHYSLFNCLTDMGYDVEQRKVTIGEDLSGYDEVIAFIAGPRQLVATTVFECLWAISEHPNCILAFDDWQVADLFKGIAKCAGNSQELFAPFILDVNKKTLEELEPYEFNFMVALNTITSMQNRMLISAFQTGHIGDNENYGPHLLFDKIDYPRNRLFTYNPNPYHRNRVPSDLLHEGAEDPTWDGTQAKPSTSLVFEEAEGKRKNFNFASLVQSKTQKWLKKQGYTGNPKNDEEGVISGWPVDLYGSKADTQKRLTEDQMCQVIAKDWGCLMPGYDHAGSGWWRARPLQCADAGSILIGEDKELRVYYGNDYEYFGLKAADLAVCTEEELAVIAATQSKCLYNIHPLDKAVQQAELTAVLGADK